MKNKALILLLALTLLIPSLLHAQRTFTLGNITAGPNEKVLGSINVSTGTKGPEIKTPVTVIKGQYNGPVMVLSACVHSQNNNPMAALQRIEDTIDTTDLYGTVIIIRIVRRASFLSRTIYHSPPEGMNLNRVYPGKISGSISERISYRLTKDIIEDCDYLVEIACNEQDDSMIPLVYCTEVGNPYLVGKTEEMARHTAMNVVVNHAYRPVNPNRTVSLSLRALFRGKPAITIESGVHGSVNPGEVDDVVNGVFGVLKKLDMLTGTIETNVDQYWIAGTEIKRAEYGGRFTTTLSSGSFVSEGQEVGAITDNTGYIYQRVTAISSGKALYVRRQGDADAGTALVLIGILPGSRPD